MDSWEPEEFALMSRYACAWCARLHQAIEEGAAWPKGAQQAKAVFLEKEGAQPCEVMSYRVLLIMAVLCRQWAPVRLKSLEPWINKWAVPDVYTGAGTQGAEDAWYQTLVDIEVL